MSPKRKQRKYYYLSLLLFLTPFFPSEGPVHSGSPFSNSSGNWPWKPFLDVYGDPDTYIQFWGDLGPTVLHLSMLGIAWLGLGCLAKLGSCASLAKSPAPLFWLQLWMLHSNCPGWGRTQGQDLCPCRDQIHYLQPFSNLGVRGCYSEVGSLELGTKLVHFWRVG